MFFENLLDSLCGVGNYIYDCCEDVCENVATYVSEKVSEIKKSPSQFMEFLSGLLGCGMVIFNIVNTLVFQKKQMKMMEKELTEVEALLEERQAAEDAIETAKILYQAEETALMVVSFASNPKLAEDCAKRHYEALGGDNGEPIG